MTEINETPIIKDENYLLTHDLCDLPGLSEYQTQKSEKNKSNQKRMKKYERVMIKILIKIKKY